MIKALLINHETGKTGTHQGGLASFVNFIFGESWQLLYTFSSLSILFLLLLLFFLPWCEGAEVIQLLTCWFLAALFWSLGFGWFCTLKAFVVQSVQEQRNGYDERLEMGQSIKFSVEKFD